MRVVLDTNVLVSGIHWSGDSEKILRDWFLGKFKLISSLQIIEEYVKTLASFKVPMDFKYISWWESLIVEKVILVMPKGSVNIVKEDADDNKFIEAAIEGNADYIITQDKHLLKLKEFKGIKIVTPKEFLKLFNE